MPTKRGMTPAEYARHRDCDRRTVVRSIADGEIPTLRNGKVDVAAADESWTPRIRRPRKTESEVTPEPPATPEPTPKAVVEPRAATIKDLRERYEAAKAEKLEWELEQKRGNLVDLAKVRDAVLAFAVRVGQAIEDDSGAAQAIADACGGTVEVRDVSIGLEEWKRRVREQLANSPIGDP